MATETVTFSITGQAFRLLDLGPYDERLYDYPADVEAAIRAAADNYEEFFGGRGRRHYFENVPVETAVKIASYFVGFVPPRVHGEAQSGAMDVQRALPNEAQRVAAEGWRRLYEHARPGTHAYTSFPNDEGAA